MSCLFWVQYILNKTNQSLSGDLFIVLFSDYSHYMAAVVKYYVGPCFPKHMKQERFFMINCFKALFWSKDVERDLILFSMLVLGYAHPDGGVFRLVNT